MSESFGRFFALSESPFSKEIPDSDLWLPPSKQALVDELCEAVHERSQVLLVGEPGAGKTCVLRALRHRLPQAGFRLTYCHNATLGRRDFYRQLCQALGLTLAATAAAV
ncbi:AAA family ATPase [Sorangium sp. So ce394]|uniref:AAA family ATPase n=1 Tax=Sorangium sp. So ce394 TaxID=3133310 RepID=UPI003F5B4CC8